MSKITSSWVRKAAFKTAKNMVKFGTPGLLQKKGLQGQSDVKRPQQPPDIKPRLLRTPLWGRISTLPSSYSFAWWPLEVRRFSQIIIMGKYRVIMEAVIPILKANRLSLLNRMIPRKYFEFSPGGALVHTYKKASKWTLGPWPDFGPKMLKPTLHPRPCTPGLCNPQRI